MEDKFKLEIEQEVEKIFAGKKEEDMRKRTEKALGDSASTIENLSTELESEKEKSAELATNLTTAEEALKTSETEKVEMEATAENTNKTQDKEVEELKNELAEKVAELDSIKKDALAATRMEELSSAGVARSDKDEQIAKIKEMSDEEFVSYKSELEAVRANILEELKDNKKEKPAKKADKVKPAEETAADEDAGKDDEVKTPPVNIDPGQSVAAAMNMEIYPSEDLLSKYADMGKAMAEDMLTDK